MTPTPRRYQFDMPMPPVEPRPLPVRRPDDETGSGLVRTLGSEQQVWQAPQPVQQVVHIHEAPPDRTLQRVALGAGMGAGAVAAGVYFGPLLIASLWSIAITFAVGGTVLVAILRVLGSLLNPEPKPTRRGRRR